MREKFFLGRYAFLAFASVLLFSSCAKGTQSSAPKEGSVVERYVHSLPSVKQRMPFEERAFEEKAFNMMTSSRAASAASKEYEQAKEVEEMLLFDEDQELFYPGALLRSKEWVNGSYEPIIVERKPITISTTLLNSEGSVITVEKPKLSSVREAISKLLTREYDAPAANLTYSSEEIHSEKHLKIALGLNYTGASSSAKLNGMFDFKEDKNYFLVKIQQVYYTIDIDMPASPADFFLYPEKDYSEQLGDAKPIYVSSIKMGRVFLLGVETSLSKTEVQSKIQASFLSGNIGAEAETAFDYLKKNSTITARVLGGDATLSAMAITDVTQVSKLLSEGAKFSRTNPGAPIAYKLRELGTNKPFKTVIYSKYHKNNARYQNKKISFQMYFNTGALKSSTGATLYHTGKCTLEITRKGGGAPVKEELYFGNSEIKRRLEALGVGDKVVIRFDRSHLNDGFKNVYEFTLPDIESLIARHEQLKGKSLYDAQDTGALILTDATKTLTLTLELENQSVVEAQ